MFWLPLATILGVTPKPVKSFSFKAFDHKIWNMIK